MKTNFKYKTMSIQILPGNISAKNKVLFKISIKNYDRKTAVEIGDKTILALKEHFKVNDTSIEDCIDPELKVLGISYKNNILTLTFEKNLNDCNGNGKYSLSMTTVTLNSFWRSFKNRISREYKEGLNEY